MNETLLGFINLGILLAVLGYYLREPLRTFVRTRHEGLRDELKNVRELLTEAQTKYDEFTSKLGAMEAEAATLRDQARHDAQQAKSRILAEAQKLSATIVSDARASAQDLYTQLRHELFAEVGVKVLDRAEAILVQQLNNEDRARIRNEFSGQVETVQ